MLRALRRVLRPGGALALTTIEVADTVVGADRRRAILAGPRGVTTRRPYSALLSSAGFVDIDSRDLTPEYVATMRAWLAAYLRRRDALAQAEGEESVAERLQLWTEATAVAERGWLRRTLHWAQRPGSPPSPAVSPSPLGP